MGIDGIMNMFGPDRFGQEVTMAEIEIEKVYLSYCSSAVKRP